MKFTKGWTGAGNALAEKHIPHRADIDGLRAIAVLGVLLYHYGLAPVSGGFTGVDIFFVISGFLITTNLKSDLEAGSFSILGFYDRRMRRIVPALMVMLALTLIAGWLLLMPGDYASLGESTAYAAFGLGNFYFYHHTGYFNAAADLQPMLHTWSLGVEEQFYLLWPIGLWAATKVVKSRRMFIGIFAVCLAVAFAYAVRKTLLDPNGAFYMPWGRAWELAIGGILAFLPTIKRRSVTAAFEAAGLLLIAISFFTLNDLSPFPGLNAAYSCVGAAALLWPKRDGWLGSSGLSVPPLRWIGLISYSLYLWHWPVLVLFRQYNSEALPTTGEAWALALVSTALAIASYLWVETPARRLRPIPWKAVAASLAVCLLLAAPAIAISESGGVVDRIAPQFDGMQSLDAMWQWPCRQTVKFSEFEKSDCVFGAKWDGSPHALLWGDSHAAAMAPLVDDPARRAGISVLLLNEIGAECPAPLDGVNVLRIRADYPKYNGLCARDHARAISWLDHHPEATLVIFTASWPDLSRVISSPEDPSRSQAHGNQLIRQGLERLINRLQTPGRRFLLVADVPQWSFDPDACEISKSSGLLRSPCDRDLHVTRQYFDWSQASTQELFRTIASETPNTTAVFPAERMCDQEKCIAEIDGQLLYRDSGHLRRNLPAEIDHKFAQLIGLYDALGVTSATPPTTRPAPAQTGTPL